MPLGTLACPSILEAPLSPVPATLPQAVVLATSSHFSRTSHRHLTPRRVHTPLSTIGGQARFLLALVLPAPIPKRVNQSRLSVLRPTAMGALEAQGLLPQAKVGFRSHNHTHLAGHPVPSLRLLPVAGPRLRILSSRATTRQAELQRTRTRSLPLHLRPPTPTPHLKVPHSGGHKRLHAHL